jgi:TetR/AcrR family transcriptional regulator, transcriptional repressor for nem operon
MRYSKEHSKDTRSRILSEAGRAFRVAGFSGVGIDGLAKAAGVTSGAFYGHFGSKSDAFRVAVIEGLKRFRAGLGSFIRRDRVNWVQAFVAFYLGDSHRADVANGCALPSLTLDVARADRRTRSMFRSELLKAADEMAAALGAESRDLAWSTLAQLVGGVILSRAVADEKLSKEIALAVSANISRAVQLNTP